MQLFVRTQTDRVWRYTVIPNPDGVTAGMYCLTGEGQTDPDDFTQRCRMTTVPMTVGEDFVTYTLPRSDAPVQWFKVCDSTEEVTCAEDFYDKGDTIPAGRLWGEIRPL